MHKEKSSLNKNRIERKMKEKKTKAKKYKEDNRNLKINNLNLGIHQNLKMQPNKLNLLNKLDKI